MWFEPYMVRAEHGFFSARTHLRIDIKNELHNNREVKSMEDKLLEELYNETSKKAKYYSSNSIRYLSNL